MRAHSAASGPSKGRPPFWCAFVRALAIPTLFCALLTIAWGSAKADDTVFDGGATHCAWVDGASLELHIELDAPGDVAQPMTWVLTVTADRSADGIFAWQMHLGEGIESVLIIPNDFLTARNFTLSQIGIEMLGQAAGASLRLRIPRREVIAELVAPGNRIDVHALWIQQAPIVSLTVPPATESVALEAGGGATADESELSGEPSTSPLPTTSVYVRGEVIRRRFVRLDDKTGEPMLRVGSSYTLARAHENAPYEIVRVARIAQDPVTGILEYEIDTAPLQEGTYELIIVTALSAETYRLKLTILSSAE
ncbi:hypothetical protein ACFLSF_00875 [Candidatus Bipolaricaulota bacterium]